MEIKFWLMIIFVSLFITIPFSFVIWYMLKELKELEREEKSYSHTEEEYYERIKETKEKTDERI